MLKDFVSFFKTFCEYLALIILIVSPYVYFQQDSIESILLIIFSGYIIFEAMVRKDIQNIAKGKIRKYFNESEYISLKISAMIKAILMVYVTIQIFRFIHLLVWGGLECLNM